MRQATFRFFLLPLFFVLVCAGVFAQSNSTVTGIVTDQMGAAISGADITLTDPATGGNHATVSGSTGLYSVGGLNPANYDLKVVVKGFQTYVQKGVVVNVSGTFRVDVKMTVGAATQTVTVQADALAVQTDTNVISSLVSSEEISEIATENRNFVGLAALGLGVSSLLPDANTPGAVGANFQISVNGLRQSHNIWLIDGGESDDRGGAGGMQIQPSQDAVAEFQMMSSNYPPDYGISSGATISLSLKSGTKTFHGTAWEENRNTDYNANTYFNKQGGNSRPAVKYNIYGFNVGGPLFIPKTYNEGKKKTFFFYNEEWRKTSGVASSNNPTLPHGDIPTLGTPLPYVEPSYSPVSLGSMVVPNVSTTSDVYTRATNGLAALGLTGAPSGPPGNTNGYPITGTPGPGNCFNGTTTWALNPGATTTLPSDYHVVCTGQQTIPAALFDPNAVIYLRAGVLPNPNYNGSDPAKRDTNIASVSLPFVVRDDIVRIDHNFNDKWAILGHYIGDTQNQSTGGPELGWCGCNYNTLTSILTTPAHSAAIKLSGTIKPNLLMEVSINYDGNGIDILPSANTYLPSTWTVSPVVAPYTVTRKIWPGMNWGAPLGKAEDTATEPYHNAAQDYAPKLDVSYTTGKHALKFGVGYNRYTKNQMLYGDEQGNYTFGALTNDTLMDTLLGLPNKFFQTQSAPIRHYVNQTPSVYAMDNWHVTPRLTLQLGVRYDALPHAYERQNLLGNFVQSTYQPNAAPVWNSTGTTISATSPDLYTYNGIPSYVNGTQFAGVNHTPAGVVTNDFKTLQPRVGFSEDLFGNGKTVVRGGFGTFYERMQGNDVFGVATSAPFDPSLTLANPYFSTPGKAWDTGNVIAPTSLIFASSQDSLATTYKAPGVAQFSLGVQREIMPSLIWVVQYVGNIAWHQNIVNNAINSYSPGIGLVDIGAPGSPNIVDPRMASGDGSAKFGSDPKSTFKNLGGGDAFRQFPGYTGITQDQNTTNGTYNGFQTGLRVQNKWGLSGEIDYTWSHEIDLTSSDRSNISNPWNLKYDKGSGQYDRRHILSINYIYKVPLFNKSTGLVKSIAGGWEFAGTVVDESGTPLVPTLNISYDPVGLNGGYTNRPNYSGGKMTYKKTVNNWFDITHWTPPTPSWAGGNNLGFGNVGRDAIVGPGRVNFTTSMYKAFTITDRAKFVMRFSSFNTFNHAQFNGVDVGFGDGNFGKLTGTYDPRNLELGGRLVF